MKMKNALLVGFGRMGQKYHSILKSLKFKEIDLIEKKKEHRDLALKNFKISQKNIFNKLGKHHKKKDYYLIIISTTTDEKFNIFKDIASKRIQNIFFEKPISRSLTECKKIKEISNNYKINITANHQWRFSNQIREIEKFLNKYKNQKLNSVNAITGNIGLAMGGSHLVEVFNYLTKNRISNVSALLENKKTSNPRGKKFIDYTGEVICRNSKNQTLNMSISSKKKHGYVLIFNFTSGYIFLDLLSGNIYSNFRKKKYEKFLSGYYALPSIIEKKKIKLSNLEHITKENLINFLNKKNYSSLNDSIEAIKVIIAAYESNILNGKNINLKNFKSKRVFKWA